MTEVLTVDKSDMSAMQRRMWQFARAARKNHLIGSGEIRGSSGRPFHDTQSHTQAGQIGENYLVIDQPVPVALSRIRPNRVSKWNFGSYYRQVWLHCFEPVLPEEGTFRTSLLALRSHPGRLGVHRTMPAMYTEYTAVAPAGPEGISRRLIDYAISVHNDERNVPNSRRANFDFVDLERHIATTDQVAVFDMMLARVTEEVAEKRGTIIPGYTS